MKKIVSAFLLAIGITGTAQQLEATLLWKISGKDLEKPSYLFGTMHATCDATLSYKVQEALFLTDQLYLEMNLSDPNMQMEMMKNMIMTDGSTLDKLLTADEYERLDKLLQENAKVSVKTFNQFKPFMLSSFLLPSLLDCPVQSVESKLMEKTKEQEEPIFGLETLAEQTAIFDKIPYTEQARELVKSLDKPLDEQKEMLKKMMEFYQKEDLNALYKMSTENKADMTGKFEKELLVERNKKWIEKIVKAAQEKPTFFGVGAAHLAGKEGVISLLKKQGYAVEPILD